MHKLTRPKIGSKEQEIQMATQHTLRVRSKRWEAIEKKAWELSIKAQKPIKPTDVADALLHMNVGKVTIDDIEEARKHR